MTFHVYKVKSENEKETRLLESDVEAVTFGMAVRKLTTKYKNKNVVVSIGDKKLDFTK